jgi:hypothetical protein
MSAQLLYVFETPGEEYSKGRHRAGLSLKTDIKLGVFEPGLLLDALYTADSDNISGFSGLSASVGFDYSLFGGDLYLLTEYLYSGFSSFTARTAENLAGFANRNYLYAMLRYGFSDYTSVSVGCMVGFDDASFTPQLILRHELFQGLDLVITAQVPLDSTVFADGGERGEFGPIAPSDDGVERGYSGLFTIKFRLRF